jgi:hypothetical protein
MTAAWICSLILIGGLHLKSNSKIEMCFMIVAIFGYLSFLAYLTYMMGK